MGRNDDRADAARRMGLARRIWDAARDAREPRGALSRRSRPHHVRTAITAQTLALHPIVRIVIILADHDVSGAGKRAAWSGAARWLAEGRRVRIAMPPKPRTDFNDVLKGCTNAKTRDVAA